MDTIFGMEAIGFWIIVTGALVGVSGALLGNYLVLRRMSLIGDAISHAVLPGLAIAFAVSGSRHPLPMLLGAAAAGLLTVVLTDLICRFARVNEDAAIGVVFTGMFALGVVLISKVASQVDLDAGCVLYGILESVPLDTTPVLGLEIPVVTLNLGALALLVTGFVTLFWKELKLVSFDPGLATAIGIHAGLVHYLLMFMVAAFTVVAFEAVGSILVVAMLVVPSATAYLLSDRLKWMAILSVIAGILSAVLGRQLANHYETSVAGMMAVAAGGQLVLAVLFSPRYGYLARRVFRLRMALRITREDILALLYRLHERAPERPTPMTQVWEALGTGALPRTALFLSRRLGQVQRSGAELHLTPAGMAAGSKLIQKHRLWESWLSKHTTLADDHLHAPAHRMEHFIDQGLLDKVAADAEHPALDPHGKPIGEIRSLEAKPH